jgi:hypothetical protein
MDTYDDFERQQRSFDLIDQHRATLAAEATQIAKEHPGARMVGLILEADSPEAGEFRRVLELPDSIGCFVGVIPRKMALDILGQSAPAGLDWVADDSGGPIRKLPILLSAKTGFRFGLAEYDVRT